MDELEEQNSILRSCRSREVSFVKFCNKTNNDVTIDWIDYDGKHQCYIARFKPGWQLPIKTFVGHPWMAYENQFRHTLVFSPSRNVVFFPEPSKMVNGLPTQQSVSILSPMCSLEKLCLQTLHKRLNDQSAIAMLDIPAILKERLRKLFYLQRNPRLTVRMNKVD